MGGCVSDQEERRRRVEENVEIMMEEGGEEVRGGAQLRERETERERG